MRFPVEATKCRGVAPGAEWWNADRASLLMDCVSWFSVNWSWLNMDSGQFAWLRHQQLQKGFEQAFTPDPDVVHALKEAQVERQFFL